MTRQTVAPIGIVLVVAACATAPAPPPAQTDRIVVTTENRVLEASEGTPSKNVTVQASRDQVLDALRRVYSELGIEVGLYDPGIGQVGNRNFAKTGRLAGEPISRFLGCGMMVSGEAADNYRVTMSVISQVTATEAGVNLETWLTAAARDLGTSSANVSCASKGTLETRINQLARERTAH